LRAEDKKSLTLRLLFFSRIGKKMADCIINPQRNANEPQLPESGIMLINPAEAALGMRIAGQKKGQRLFLYNSNLFIINQEADPFFLAGPAVGAPMAVLTLEKLIALGAKNIFVLGWCGSLRRELRIGDILLPTWGLSEEGTSAHYPVSFRPQSALELRNRFNDIFHKAYQISQGPIWTTDAPYRETRDKVTQYAGQGIMAVDMEFSALLTVAAFRKVKLAGAMLVSDELYQPVWQPGFKSKSFRKQSRNFLQLLLENFGTG
jgi:uridine phosphorylase